MTLLITVTIICDLAAIGCALVAGAVFHDLGDPFSVQLRREDRTRRSADLRFWAIGLLFLALAPGCAFTSHAIWWVS